MQCGKRRSVAGGPLDERAQSIQVARTVRCDARVRHGNKTQPPSLGENVNLSFARVECLEECTHVR